jgi:hypothetical protein
MQSFNIHRESNDLLWTYTDKPDLYIKHTQYVPAHLFNYVETKSIDHSITQSEPIETVSVQSPETIECVCTKSVKSVKSANKCKQRPLDIIILLSENNVINIDYIKQSIQSFIDTKDFQKVFTLKKTSEIMKGITENKWNKSLVLFISFIFDVSFVYLGKDVIYDTNNISKYTNKIII